MEFALRLIDLVLRDSQRQRPARRASKFYNLYDLLRLYTCEMINKSCESVPGGL